MTIREQTIKSNREIVLHPKIDNFINRKKGRFLFVAGTAFTGVSEQLKLIRSKHRHSSTLVAANKQVADSLNGISIHSVFREIRLDENNQVDLDLCEAFDWRKLRKNLILLPKFSMFSAAMFEQLDATYRALKDKPDEPFGGAKVIMFGDEFQLPPFKATSAYFSDVFKEHPFKILRLKERPEQKNVRFASGLKIFSKGKGQKDDSLSRVLKHFNKNCVDPKACLNADIILCATNAIVEKYNQRRFDELPGKAIKAYKTANSGTNYTQGRAPVDLYLKPGCRVMATQKIYINYLHVNQGSLGTIVKCLKDQVLVLFDGDERHVEVCDENYSSRTNGYPQLPLTWGFAMTIYQARGRSFGKIFVDFGDETFGKGMVYTALSRVRSIKGIKMERELKLRDIKPNLEGNEHLKYLVKRAKKKRIKRAKNSS